MVLFLYIKKTYSFLRRKFRIFNKIKTNEEHMNFLDKLVDAAFNFQIESNYKRIKSGKHLDINKKPYNMSIINKMLNFFQEQEEYEKCQVLKDFKNKILDHENNYSKY